MHINEETKKLVSDYYFSLFGEKITFDTFNNRLKFQKMVYILTYFDLLREDLKPIYNWYVRGPYSANVADIGYDLTEKNIPVKIMDIPEKLSYFKEIKGDIRKIELYASLLFLKNAGYCREEAIREILVEKPDYSREEVEEMITHIRDSKRTRSHTSH